MDYGNHFVREAICTFRFVNYEQTKDYLEYTWQFYQAIKEDGFTQKQRRPVHVNLKLHQDVAIEDVTPTVTQGSIATVFTNSETGYSIIFDEDLISFNCVNNYRGWDLLVNEFIIPYLHKYIDLGIPQQLQNAQMAYINDVPLGDSERLSDYLAFIPAIGMSDKSNELAIVFQGHYQMSPTVIASAQAMLNPEVTDGEKRAIIECNSIATASEPVDKDWLNHAMSLASQAHLNARIVFDSIVTPHFKNRIK